MRRTRSAAYVEGRKRRDESRRRAAQGENECNHRMVNALREMLGFDPLSSPGVIRVARNDAGTALDDLEERRFFRGFHDLPSRASSCRSEM